MANSLTSTQRLRSQQAIKHLKQINMQNFKKNKFGNRGNILKSSLANQKNDHEEKFDVSNTYNVIGKVAQLSSR